MKKYWPFMGAVGVVAAIGLYAYVSRNYFYKEQETEEFVEEEIEYEEELPEEEVEKFVPYNSARSTEKEKTNSKKYYEKEEKTGNRAYNPSIPKSLGLEETVEEEEKEYDLPPEKRIALTTNWNLENVKDRMEELEKYYQESLDADDFKVAALYITDFQRFMEAERYSKPEAYQKIEDDLTYHIATKYNSYLSEVIENCNKHSFDSVFRKVMWMNVFLAEHQNQFTQDISGKEPSLANFTQKGNQALEAIEYCHE